MSEHLNGNGSEQPTHGTNGNGQTHGKKWSWVYKEYRRLSWLIDDLDLTPAEHRIATHLLRRGMDKGKAYSFKETIAKDTGIHRNTVAIIVKVLATKGMVSIEHEHPKPRQRERDVYTWLRPETWAKGIFREGSKGEKWQASLVRVQPESALDRFECNLRVHTSATSECTIEEASITKKQQYKKKQQADEASSSSPAFAFDLESDSSATEKERTKPKERSNGSKDVVEATPKTKTLLKGSRPARRARQEKPVDSDFIQALQDNSPGINVEEQIQKMKRWLLAHPERKFTRQFVINWINRTKPETPTNGNGQRAVRPGWIGPETPEEKEARWAREEAYGRGEIDEL